MIPLGFLYRAKYYSAWYFSQASVNIAGLSESPSGEYDKVTTGSIYFEL